MRPISGERIQHTSNLINEAAVLGAGDMPFRYDVNGPPTESSRGVDLPHHRSQFRHVFQVLLGEGVVHGDLTHGGRFQLGHLGHTLVAASREGGEKDVPAEAAAEGAVALVQQVEEFAQRVPSRDLRAVDGAEGPERVRGEGVVAADIVDHDLRPSVGVAEFEERSQVEVVDADIVEEFQREFIEIAEIRPRRVDRLADGVTHVSMGSGMDVDDRQLIPHEAEGG